MTLTKIKIHPNKESQKTMSGLYHMAGHALRKHGLHNLKNDLKYEWHQLDLIGNDVQRLELIQKYVHIEN